MDFECLPEKLAIKPEFDESEAVDDIVLNTSIAKMKRS